MVADSRPTPGVDQVWTRTPPESSEAIIDSQSVKNGGQSVGYDAGKKSALGRKRFMTATIFWASLNEFVTAASVWVSGKGKRVPRVKQMGKGVSSDHDLVYWAALMVTVHAVGDKSLIVQVAGDRSVKVS